MNEYPSEEDDINPWTSKGRKLIEKAELFNTEIVQAADPAKISAAVSQQISLLGSRRLYERINYNLKMAEFEAHFAKEQCDLFSWRLEYFKNQFPEEIWFTDGSDDSHDLDTIPFQVTENFDSVVALASSPRPTNSGRIYFANDEEKSNRARWLYDRSFWEVNGEGILWNEENYIMEELGLSYSDVLHMIVAVFQSQPLKMEFLAMKKVLELELEVKPSDIPRELQVKAEKGFFSRSDQILPFINEEGRKLLEILENDFEV